ncbi:prolyl oligopeptidase family serine peptidase [Acetobacter sp. AN02]|uniref:prolyl oligopeptidase family serine peptidase n=1 Tax=Acetobacter sp. AN02 TaxID=2894186 RepID=UPI0024344078|nr:prolyl oligopeptidase family serine peptidase [Acetobacter sp. AN02]MDG6095632.1 prolyl oligopeptidase family serine peptidase [Acetobacter sp. AN02]
MSFSARLLSAAFAVSLAAGSFFSCPASADPVIPDRAALSEVNGAAALGWVRAQNQRTAGDLESDPRYDGFYRDALSALENPERMIRPRFLNGRVWDFWQDAHHPRGIWRNTVLASLSNALPGWTTRLDIDALAAREKKDWVFRGAECLEPEERFCLVALSESGEDAVTLREYDTRAGLFVLHGFTLPRGRQQAVWVDRDTLLVARDQAEDGSFLTASGYPFSVQLLRRDQPLSQAHEVVRGEKTDVALTPLVLTDDDGRRVFLIHREVTFFGGRYAVLEGTDQGGTPALRWLDLPSRSEIQGLVHGRLVLTTAEDWTPQGGAKIPAGSLVSASLSDPGRDVDVIFTPDATQSVQDVGITRNTVVVSVLENVRGAAFVFSRDGASWKKLRLPLPDMSTVHVLDTDRASDHAFLTVEGYLTPPELWLTGTGGSQGTAEKIREMPPLFDASAMTVRQFRATSSDGTKIPYFIVSPKDMRNDGGNPVLMTAYGGFQATYTPLYAPEIGRLWLQHGGVYVVAGIRGGGEYGPAWHEAGRKTHRQRVYDDFFAVGRDLVSRGITSAAHLGIRGRSNGGLLAGVAFTQHPEMWNAVIIGVPLLDMLNYETMAAGASWADEYGSVSVPAEKAFLQKISPLQHLRKETDYPVPFIFTSTKDDRVGPVHARLFAARLKALGKPFFYYEDTEGGHSGTANAKEIAHERALEAVYLTRRLMEGAGATKGAGK